MRKKIILVLVIACLLQLKGNAQVNASSNEDGFRLLKKLPLSEMSIVKDKKHFINNLDRLKVNMFLINEFCSPKTEKLFCKVTNDEIQLLGARNLVEILNIISKFNYDCSSISYNQFSDIEGELHEITLLFNGLELYRGKHYSQMIKKVPLSAIESIEIHSERKKTLMGDYETINIINVTTVGT